MRRAQANGDHDPSLLTVIDIETTVSEEAVDPTGGFVKWPHHRPVVASLLTSHSIGGGNYDFTLKSVICRPGAEGEFYHEVDAAIPAYGLLCGWNTAGFDLPVLALGAISTRQFASTHLSRCHRANRFSVEHADLAELYSSRGAAPKLSLAEVCGRLGVPVKTNSHGSEVAELHAVGRHDEIVRYCEEDVAATAVAAWAWFAWRDGNDALLAEPLAAFSDWIEAAPQRGHLLGIARCEPARWARRRALVLAVEHARDRAARRLQHERRRRIFSGEEPLFSETEPAF